MPGTFPHGRRSPFARRPPPPQPSSESTHESPCAATHGCNTPRLDSLHEPRTLGDRKDKASTRTEAMVRSASPFQELPRHWLRLRARGVGRLVVADTDVLVCSSWPKSPTRIMEMSPKPDDFSGSRPLSAKNARFACCNRQCMRWKKALPMKDTSSTIKRTTFSHCFSLSLIHI